MNNINANQKTISSTHKSYEKLTPEEKKKFERNIKLAVGAVLGAGYIGPIFARALAHYQVCLNKLLPEQALDLINANAQFLSILASYPLMPFINMSAFKTAEAAFTIITMPIMEEIECRFLFQELLLRRIPKAILNKCAPSYAHLIEAKVTRVARVALSTLLFFLLHTARAGDHSNPCLGSNYGFAVIGLGGWLGAATEMGGGVKGLGLSILGHIFMNAIAYTIGATSLK